MPGRRFPGTLVRTSDSFDPATRTLNVEVDVPNKEGQLFPGAYAEVHFRMKSEGDDVNHSFHVADFPFAGTARSVLRDGKAALIPVTTGRDFGNTVEVLTGLTANDQVIANPSDSLVEGEQVRVVSAKTAHATED